MSRGTAQLNLSPIETKNIKMKLPPVSILDKFYGEAEPLFSAITENYQQIQTLTTLRDTLLPRLISENMKQGTRVSALDSTRLRTIDHRF